MRLSRKNWGVRIIEIVHRMTKSRRLKMTASSHQGKEQVAYWALNLMIHANLPKYYRKGLLTISLLFLKATKIIRAHEIETLKRTRAWWVKNLENLSGHTVAEKKRVRDVSKFSNRPQILVSIGAWTGAIKINLSLINLRLLMTLIECQ